MTGIPYRSKLEPHLEYIRDSRRKRLTWKEIAEEIQKKGTPCTRQGVRDYFKRRPNVRVPLGFEPDPPKPTPLTKRTPEEHEAEYLKKAEAIQTPQVRGKILDLE